MQDLEPYIPAASVPKMTYLVVRSWGFIRGTLLSLNLHSPYLRVGLRKLVYVSAEQELRC